MIDLKQIQSAVGAWAVKNFGNQASYLPLLGVVEELGELCHAHVKLEQGIRTNEDHWEGKIDAVGDVVIYLLDYCSKTGIDLEETIASVWLEVKKRDWTIERKQNEAKSE